MTSGVPNINYTYNQVPYPSLSHAGSHPDNLATLARLLGMQPAPVDSCRVLELGCGVGGNLIPMACALPGSKFLGIDLAERQIEDGNQKIAALGLANIVLKQMDILDVTPDLGQFDYIIAHGVFSWVPPVVQDKILEISRQNLAPQGVAFISYNIYPGWHMINIARGMMRYYTRDITDPDERAREARNVIRWFANAGETETNGYYGYLKMYADYLEGETDGGSPKDDSALLHDELEDLNQPLYFSEFVERATAHDLQYLGELLHYPINNHLAARLEEMREWNHSLIDLEQSCDFLQNRTFRQTVVCHKEIVINRRVTPERLEDFYISSAARPSSHRPDTPVPGGSQSVPSSGSRSVTSPIPIPLPSQGPDAKPDIAGRSVVQFSIQSGATFSTDHPLSKAAMLCLEEAWPRPIKFDALYQEACLRLERERQENGIPQGEGSIERKGTDRRILAANLLKAYDYNSSLVELHTFDSYLCSQPGERPIASPWAVLQLKDQDWVTNLRHERVSLDPFDRFLLSQLDGRKDLKDLVEVFMKGPVAEGLLTLEGISTPDEASAQTQEAQEMTERKSFTPEEQRALLADEIKFRLTWLTKVALLSASSKPASAMTP